MVALGEKVAVFGKRWLFSSKVVVFGQKWLYSGKVVLFGQNCLYSGKVFLFGQNACNRGGWLYMAKYGCCICCIIAFVQGRFIRAKLLY